MIDDMAQIAGVRFLCLAPADGTFLTKAESQLQKKTCVFIRGIGALCLASDPKKQKRSLWSWRKIVWHMPMGADRESTRIWDFFGCSLTAQHLCEEIFQIEIEGRTWQRRKKADGVPLL